MDKRLEDAQQGINNGIKAVFDFLFNGIETVESTGTGGAGMVVGGAIATGALLAAIASLSGSKNPKDMTQDDIQNILITSLADFTEKNNIEIQKFKQIINVDGLSSNYSISTITNNSNTYQTSNLVFSGTPTLMCSGDIIQGINSDIYKKIYRILTPLIWYKFNEDPTISTTLIDSGSLSYNMTINNGIVRYPKVAEINDTNCYGSTIKTLNPVVVYAVPDIVPVSYTSNLIVGFKPTPTAPAL
jgi:hypothetical protein